MILNYLYEVDISIEKEIIIVDDGSVRNQREFIEEEIRKKRVKFIRLHENQGKGVNIRDWIYVDDHCKAILKVLLDGRIGQIYNIGGDSEISNIDLVKKILKILDKPESLITFVKDRPGHDLRYAIDHNKITKELGWKPDIKFEKGIELTVQWYLHNEEWLKNVITKEYLTYYEKQYKSR